MRAVSVSSFQKSCSDVGYKANRHTHSARPFLCYPTATGGALLVDRLVDETEAVVKALAGLSRASVTSPVQRCLDGHGRGDLEFR